MSRQLGWKNTKYLSRIILTEANGWKDSWRDWMYEYLHFHTHTHEVLGIARGTVRAEFGGAKGKILDLPCTVAVDLASKIDIAALILLFEREGKLFPFGRFYLPESAIEEARNASYRLGPRRLADDDPG